MHIQPTDSRVDCIHHFAYHCDNPISGRDRRESAQTRKFSCGVLPALAGETVSGASVRLGSDSCASFGCPVKTRPASAARPSLLYRTCKLILASLFQGAVSGMKDSCGYWGRREAAPGST